MAFTPHIIAIIILTWAALSLPLGLLVAHLMRRAGDRPLEQDSPETIHRHPAGPNPLWLASKPRGGQGS